LVAEPPLVIEPLSPNHDRAAFSCGEPVLDAYLQRQASQDVNRRVTRVFVAIGKQPKAIAGYCSLSAASFDKRGLPPQLSKRLPHYPIPAAILGRLAVDKAYQGRKLGETMLMDACRRVVRASEALAMHALVVDAMNDRALAFYQRYGFQRFSDSDRRLFLPLETIEKLRL
jgi:ribosomal protein S18 acetylase RimI-like enzyme